LLETDNGANLLTAYRRAANIIRIEARRDGPYDNVPSEALVRTDEERGLFRAIVDADADISACLKDDNYETALSVLTNLRSPLDVFFDKVTVNAPQPELRLNRLRLLHKVRSTMDRIADFSKIEG
jgi:glycyl-tRNA synthetase beta chain